MIFFLHEYRSNGSIAMAAATGTKWCTLFLMFIMAGLLCSQLIITCSTIGTGNYAKEKNVNAKQKREPSHGKQI